jgi:hypothetical protein
VREGGGKEETIWLSNKLPGGGGGAAVWTTLGLALRENRETERVRRDGRRRSLVRIPYGSPARRCIQSYPSFGQGSRRSCPTVERESERKRE